MAGISPDVLSQLLGASWRKIGFPSLMFSAKGSHNVVLHKRVDRNGWRVENTGLNGYVHSFKIPFINSIVPGVNETWGSEPLYPATYRRMMAALEDRTSDTFVHPDFGQRKCKAGEWESTLDPEFRGGPTLVVQLLETVDDAGDAVPFAQTSVLPLAVAAAQSLDAGFALLIPPPNTGTPGGMSLADFFTSIGNIADEWNLLKMQWAAAIDRVAYQLGQLAEKFGDEPGFSDKTNRLIAALHAIKTRALASSKRTAHHQVLTRTSVAALAIRLRNSVADLIKLNPNLVKAPIVQPGTRVRYYP